MRKLLTILSIVIVALVPVTMDGADNIKKRITLKKIPRKDDDFRYQRIPTAMICCYVDSENGVEQLDTSDIETYEIWDIENTYPVAVYEDEYSFADYVLSNPPGYTIKLYSKDYIYIGNTE